MNPERSGMKYITNGATVCVCMCMCVCNGLETKQQKLGKGSILLL